MGTVVKGNEDDVPEHERRMGHRRADVTGQERPESQPARPPTGSRGPAEPSESAERPIWDGRRMGAPMPARTGTGA